MYKTCTAVTLAKLANARRNYTVIICNLTVILALVGSVAKLPIRQDLICIFLLCEESFEDGV